jgi:uncharacterized alpha/beta hydrolase family protein
MDCYISTTFNIMMFEFISNLCSFQSLKTISIILSHSIVTLPSLIYHSLINKYRKYTSNEIHYEPLSNKNVIIFVYGRNGFHTDLKPLIDNIIKQSPSFIGQEYEKDITVKINNKLYVLRTVNLGATAYTSIDEDVASLHKELEIYQNCSIVLVGLSKGGLVIARYITSNQKNSNQINKIITISAPLKGTYSALLFSPSSVVATDLGYQNKIVQQIDEKRKNIQTQIYHIVPKWDQMIIPTTAAKYDDTPNSNIYYYNGCYYSHSGIAYDVNVAKSIIQWLS